MSSQVRRVFTAALAVLVVLAFTPLTQGEEERERGFLGIRVAPIDDGAREELGYEGKSTVMVGHVVEGSPAAKAGLRPGDVIVRVGEVELGGLEGMLEVLSRKKVGDKVLIVFWREGKLEDPRIVLGPMPEEFREEEPGNEIERELEELRAGRERHLAEMRKLEQGIEESVGMILEASKAGKHEAVLELVSRIQLITRRSVLHEMEANELGRRIEEIEEEQAFRRQERIQRRAESDAEKRDREEHPEVREAKRQLEILRLAMKGLLEGEKRDAADRVEHAIHIRELNLEGRRDEEANRIRREGPKNRELAHFLFLASELWAKFGNEEAAVAIRKLGGRIMERAERGERREEPRRERREERGRDELAGRIERLEKTVHRLAEMVEHLMHKVNELAKDK